MSMADGETRSRTNQPNAYDRREPPPGPMYSSTPPRGPQPGNGKTVRGPIHASGVDWTLTLRRKLDRSGVPAHDADALAASVSRVVTVEADREIVREDDEPAECRLLLDGWTCRYIPLETARPQILALQLPGDFLDLQGLVRRRMEHVVASLTPCRVALIPHDALRDLMERRSGIGRLVHLETAVELATARRWLLNAAHRPAYEGFAHLICELFTRAAAAGIAEASRFPMPLTQAEFGSAMGLTSVHANRTLKRLRQAGLVSWRCRWMTIEDWDGLAEVAEFDPAYLKLERPAP
ncbi:Crp/Fnr family transcriptional regulator [Methylobacterium radiotolerans]|nr:Crp/Fnr family transcriptional regulator [Methylobacterium radiotolerans]